MVARRIEHDSFALNRKKTGTDFNDFIAENQIPVTAVTLRDTIIPA